MKTICMNKPTLHHEQIHAQMFFLRQQCANIAKIAYVSNPTYVDTCIRAGRGSQEIHLTPVS